MFRWKGTARHDGGLERGFTLPELLVTVTVVLILVAISFPLMSSQKDKAKTPGTQQAAIEASIAVRDFQLKNSGTLPTTTSQINASGYIPDISRVVMSACINWSNGQANKGKFMIRTYASNGSGGIDVNAKQFLFDSATDSSPREASPDQVSAQFCTAPPNLVS